jgi:hypothetical protein
MNVTALVLPRDNVPDALSFGKAIRKRESPLVASVSPLVGTRGLLRPPVERRGGSPQGPRRGHIIARTCPATQRQSCRTLRMDRHKGTRDLGRKYGCGSAGGRRLPLDALSSCPPGRPVPENRHHMKESRHWNKAKSRVSVVLQSRPDGDAPDGAVDNTID